MTNSDARQKKKDEVYKMDPMSLLALMYTDFNNPNIDKELLTNDEFLDMMFPRFVVDCQILVESNEKMQSRYIKHRNVVLGLLFIVCIITIASIVVMAMNSKR